MTAPTSLSRRTVLAGLGATVLAGCATVPRSPQAPDGTITLVDAFAGRRTGRGVFRAPIARVERGFDVILDGRLEGDVLTVREDFDWDDGEQQTLTWRFTRTEPGKWIGTREDVIGTAKVEELGNEIRLQYTADIVSRGETTRLSFADVLYRAGDGLVRNEAVVRRFGLPIGSVELDIFT